MPFARAGPAFSVGRESGYGTANLVHAEVLRKYTYQRSFSPLLLVAVQEFAALSVMMGASALVVAALPAELLSQCADRTAVISVSQCHLSHSDDGKCVTMSVLSGARCDVCTVLFSCPALTDGAWQTFRSFHM